MAKNKAAKGIISRRLKSKIQQILNEKELDQLLSRRSMGLEPKGDMSEFLKGLVKRLKQKKRSP